MFKHGSAAKLVCISLVVLAAAMGVRYGLVESGAFPTDCGDSLAEAGTALCAAKWVIIQSFLHQRLGWFSLAFGVAAFLTRRRPLAWAGWLSGLVGLILYSFDYSAVGALLSLLVLARTATQVRHSKKETSHEPGDGLRVRRFG